MRKKKYTFRNPMLKFLFTHCQIFVMNFSCDSGWHYMSLNFSSHKIHGHKHASQLRETRIDYKETASKHPNTQMTKKKKAFKNCIYVLCIKLAIIILIQ